MLLVVDTNVLVSFFRENPVRRIILKSKSLSLELYSPAYALEELRKNLHKLVKYSKLSQEEVLFILKGLEKHIKVVPDEYFKEFESEAKQLIHDKDVPIFALALKLRCSIWSNEPGFKRQSSVEVFNTRELRNSLDLA